MSSTFYFDFLGSVWDFLPAEDRERFGELWQGFEQVLANVYQKFWETRLNASVNNLQAYTTERWLPYSFTAANAINQAAVFTSTQDLSIGVDLYSRYLLRIQVDNLPAIEVDVRGRNPRRTTIDEIVAKLNLAAGFRLARTVAQGSLVQLVSPTTGPGSRVTVLEASVPELGAEEYVLGLLAADLPRAVPQFPYVFKLPYDNVASFPALRDAVRDESVAVQLAEGVDYQLGAGQTVAFKTPPPAGLWAKRTLINKETPWNNFGFLMDIYQPNSPRYVNVLQGLWFAFWTGAKPANVQRALYLLFGLPTSPDAATVTAIGYAADGVTATTVTILTNKGAAATYDVPVNLTPVVTVGQTLEKFQPLVSGIDVYDKINKPGFVANEIGRVGIQPFLTEKATRGPGADTDETKALALLQEYTFLPQIEVDAFITPDINLDNVKTFLNAIRPLTTTYLFQVIVGSFRDELDVEETHQVSSSFDVSPMLDLNPTTALATFALDPDAPGLVDYETNDYPGLNLDLNGVAFGETLTVVSYTGPQPTVTYGAPLSQRAGMLPVYSDVEFDFSACENVATIGP